MHRRAHCQGFYEQGFEMPQLLDRVCPTVSEKVNKIYRKQSLSSKMIQYTLVYIKIAFYCILRKVLNIITRRSTSMNSNDTQSQSQHSISQYY